MKHQTFLGIFGALLLVSACTGHDAHNALKKRTIEDIEPYETAAADLKGARPLPPIEVDTAPYIGRLAPTAPFAPNLPSKFEQAGAWTFCSQRPVSLSTLRQIVTRETGLNLTIERKGSQIPFDIAISPPKPTSPANQPTNLPLPANGAALLNAAIAGAAAQTTTQAPPLTFQAEPAVALPCYSGPFSTWIKDVAARFQKFVTYEDGALIFGTQIQRTFRIAAFAGSRDYDSTRLDKAASGSAGQSGSSASRESAVKVKRAFDEFDEIKRALDRRLEPGETVEVSPTMQTVTLTATSPTTEARVRDWINQWNAQALRQIKVHIDFLTVRDSAASELAFQPSLAFNDGSGNVLNFTPALAAGTTGANLVAKILNPPKGSGLGTFNGSQALIDLLDQTNEIVDRFPVTLTARSGETRVYANTETVPYIAQQNTSTSQFAQQIQITQAEKVIGTTLAVTPRLLDDGRIELEIAWDTSAIASRESRTAGTTQTDLIGIRTNKSDSGRLILVPGQTQLVLAATPENSQSIKAGTGPSWNWILGGQNNASASKTRLIALVTAREDTPAAISQR